jgi:7,8-dihydropterin-6-yl-methyl-4-(beta-D-ribofuranosyl)aminobenzene 5'-phosphate synthase
MNIEITNVEQVEILTLQDNYIDFFAFSDNNNVVQRPLPITASEKGLRLGQPPHAEHGWSSLISVSAGATTNRLLFDFGWSKSGTANNAKTLEQDMHQVDMLALSHGHIDHFGGLADIYELIDKPKIELWLHPAAFRNPRYGKIQNGMKVHQPCLTMDMLKEIGVTVKQTTTPRALFEGNMLFLTGIPRRTDFEKGIPNFFYLDENQEEKWDGIDDDSAMVIALKNKGLVIVSGCGHAGIINTIRYAQQVTGIRKIHAVIGGFHLTGPEMAHVIEPTIAALMEIDPDYIVPTHCTGWKAVTEIQRKMPEKFILNMSGTKLIFAA